MNTKTALAVIAIVAALGFVGVMTFTLVTIPQQADAISFTGECARSLKNASAQFCHNIG